MYVLQNLHWFVLLLGILVFVHELGHFVMAKLCKVKVLKFSLGFGPKVVGFQRGDTEYVISLLPLGGYVKMHGEMPDAEGENLDPKGSFSQKPVWQRTLVVLAGPTFNLILAFIVYAVLFTGTQTVEATRLGIVTKGQPAYQAGLRPGDVITDVDGKPVFEWNELREIIGKRPGERLQITFMRDAKERHVTIEPESRTEENVFQEAEVRGRIGISAAYVKPIVGVVDLDSPASIAGLKTGDLILAVNARPVTTWDEVRSEVVRSQDDNVIRLSAKRDDQETLDLSLQPVPFPEGLRLDLFSSADTSTAYTGLVSREVLINEIKADTPAAKAGLQVGDRLLGFSMVRSNDDKRIDFPVGVWSIDLAAISGSEALHDYIVTWQRGQHIMNHPLNLEERQETDELKNKRREIVFGATNDPDSIATYTTLRTLGPLAATAAAGQRVASDIHLIVTGVVKLVQGRLSFDTMGGPIMLFVIAEKSAKRGAGAFFSVLSIISINLGILNLLPIPVLDGGHLVFFAMEAIRRRPPSIRTREIANVIGLALLLLLMVLVFKNDMLRYVLG